MPGALLPIGIGAAAGLAGSVFGPKNQTTDTTSTQTMSLDPATQKALDAYRQAAMAQYRNAQNQAGNPGWGQLASNMLPLAQQTGTTGIESFFNPYQSEVIGGVQSDFDRQRALAATAAADQATRQGAFGGNRAAILQGMGARDINQNEMNVLAGLRSGGWQDALNALMGQRLQAGNLAVQGMQGNQSWQQDIFARQLAALQAMQMGLNYGGQTTTSTGQTQQPLNRNPIAGMLGGALTGYSMFGGGGGGGGGVAAPGGAWLPDYQPGGPAGGYFPQYPRPR